MAERAPIPIPTPLNLAESQVREAITETERKMGDYPHLPWVRAMNLLGPFLPGQLWTVGARPGQGKTTVLMNVMHDLVQQGTPVLYLTTETRAEELRRVWAALALSYPVDHVLENRWDRLVPGAQLEVQKHLEWQAMGAADVACFVDLPRLDVEHVERALSEYARKAQYRIILLDHIHRFYFNDASQRTAMMTQAVQWLKGMSAKYGFVMVLAAQLNRPVDKNPIVECLPAPLSALKQTGALEEESNVVLMLHRARRSDVSPAMMKEVLYGQRDARDLIEPGIMCMNVAKHRTRPSATGRMIRLRVAPCTRLDDETQREPGEESHTQELPF